jgi:hypothetical protein
MAKMEDLRNLARLLGERNTIEADITNLIGRPATLGHIGEFIASRVFNIDLHRSAAHQGSDGVFQNGPLANKAVEVKLYSQQEGILDVNTGTGPDYYLVLTGPKSPPRPSRGKAHPAFVDHVYLFGRIEVATDVALRNVKSGTATGLRKDFWDRHEVFPHSANSELPLTPEQRRLLAQFSSDPEVAANGTA